MSKTKQLTTQGIKNNNWKGYWITPKGKFRFREEASIATGISETTLRKLCKQSTLPLKSKAIRRINLLNILKVKVGTLPRDLGFGFEEVDKYSMSERAKL